MKQFGNNLKWMGFLLLFSAFFLQSCKTTQIKEDTQSSWKNRKKEGQYTISSRLYTNPPKTIAVMPFVDAVGWSKDSEEYEKMAVSTEASGYIRDAFYKALAPKPYRDVEPYFVDKTLEEKNLSHPDDINKLSQKELGEILEADALVYGKVTHFGRLWLGLYSSAYVGAAVKMVDVETGDVLWQTGGTQRYYAGGLSLNPLGLVTGAIKAAAGMRKENNYRLADQLFRHLLITLPEITEPVQPQIKVEKEGATVRAMPSSYSNKLSMLKVGDELEMVEESKGWFLVDTPDNFRGWVKGNKLAISQEMIDVEEKAIMTAQAPIGDSTEPIFPSDGAVEAKDFIDNDGIEYSKPGKNEEAVDAVKILAKSGKSMVGDPEAHLKLSYLLASEGDIIGSFLEVYKAVKLAPDKPRYWYAYGMAHYQKGDLGEAISAWEKTLELDPEFKGAKTILEIARNQKPEDLN